MRLTHGEEATSRKATQVHDGEHIGGQAGEGERVLVDWRDDVGVVGAQDSKVVHLRHRGRETIKDDEGTPEGQVSEEPQCVRRMREYSELSG